MSNLLAAAAILTSAAPALAQPASPVPDPGAARLAVHGPTITLGNDAFAARWTCWDS